MRASSGVIAALIGTILLFCAGCTPHGPAFVDEGASYSADSALTLLESSDSGDLAKMPVADAAKARQEALASLRSQGGTSREAASTITRTFSGSSRAVPYRVERATFDGVDSWVILEASGRSDGTLTDRRLWVIDTTGGVLLFGSR